MRDAWPGRVCHDPFLTDREEGTSRTRPFQEYHGAQITKGTVTNKALKSKTIQRNKVRPDTLTGAQIKESTLDQVPSAASADTAPPAGPAGGDLVGSYPDPQVGPDTIGSSELGTITRRSASDTVAANGIGSVVSSCNPGEQVIGGGNDGVLAFRIIASRNEGTTGWKVFVHNESASPGSLSVHVYCLAP